MIVCDDVTAELSRGAFEGLCLLQLSLVRNSGNASLIAGDCSPEYAYTATLVRLVASAGEMRGKAGAGRQCGRTGVCGKCLPSPAPVVVTDAVPRATVHGECSGRGNLVGQWTG